MRVWRDSVSRRDLDQTPPAALFHRRSKGVDQSNRGDRVLMVVVDPFLNGGVEPRVVGLLSGIADVVHEDLVCRLLLEKKNSSSTSTLRYAACSQLVAQNTTPL